MVNDQDKKILKVMIVDDEDITRELFKSRLQKLGYDVSEATSGDEALAITGQVYPHIVLLDQEMKGRDGLNTFLSIKELWPDLPVVMITGSNSKNLIRSFLLEGGKDFIEKPVTDFETLDFRLRKILRDIERERTIQEELIDTRARLSTRALKDLLITFIGHELRTPLHHLLGFMQILASGTYQNGLMQKIIEAGERLNISINEILEAATLEKGIVVNFYTVRLAALVQELVVAMEKSAHKKRLLLKMDVPERISLTTDPQKLFQVLKILTENAIKFTEHGEVNIFAHRKGSQIIIDVTDTGIGMTEKDAAGIFDLFGKIDQTGKKSGMGLGLYISKKLVELMGGEITFESILDSGSTFSISLPAK